MSSEQTILLLHLGGRVRGHLLDIEQRSNDRWQPFPIFRTEAVLDKRRRIGQRAEFG